MNKKRDKKKFKRKNINISNIELTDIDHFTEDEISEEKRAEKKSIEKGKISSKRDLELTKGRILEVRSNYMCLVKIGDEELTCTLGGRFKQVNFETKSIVTAGDYVNVDSSQGITQITAGNENTCLLSSDGNLKCWGSNQQNQLGYENVEFVENSQRPSSPDFVDVTFSLSSWFVR